MQIYSLIINICARYQKIICWWKLAMFTKIKKAKYSHLTKLWNLQRHVGYQANMEMSNEFVNRSWQIFCYRFWAPIITLDWMCLAHSNKTIPFLVGYGIQGLVLWHTTKYWVCSESDIKRIISVKSRERLIGKKYCSLLEISQQIIAA